MHIGGQPAAIVNDKLSRVTMCAAYISVSAAKQGNVWRGVAYLYARLPAAMDRRGDHAWRVAGRRPVVIAEGSLHISNRHAPNSIAADNLVLHSRAT